MSYTNGTSHPLPKGDDTDSDDNMGGDEEDMEEESGSLKVLVSGNTFEEVRTYVHVYICRYIYKIL